MIRAVLEDDPEEVAQFHRDKNHGRNGDLLTGPAEVKRLAIKSVIWIFSAGCVDMRSGSPLSSAWPYFP